MIDKIRKCIVSKMVSAFLRKYVIGWPWIPPLDVWFDHSVVDKRPWIIRSETNQ